MPLTHRDNGVSMGGSLKEVSILKNCYISADPKGRINSYLFRGCFCQLFNSESNVLNLLLVEVPAKLVMESKVLVDPFVSGGCGEVWRSVTWSSQNH